MRVFSALRSYILPNGVSETTDSRVLRFSISICCGVSEDFAKSRYYIGG